jgi:hypothetical protein
VRSAAGTGGRWIGGCCVAGINHDSIQVPVSDDKHYATVTKLTLFEEF